MKSKKLTEEVEEKRKMHRSNEAKDRVAVEKETYTANSFLSDYCMTGSNIMLKCNIYF